MVPCLGVLVVRGAGCRHVEAGVGMLGMYVMQ